MMDWNSIHVAGLVIGGVIAVLAHGALDLVRRVQHRVHLRVNGSDSNVSDRSRTLPKAA